MKDSFLHKKSTTIANSVIPLLFAFILPWPIHVFNWVLALCFIIVLFERLWLRKLDLRVFKTEIYMMLIASIILLATGLLYTNDLKAGFIELERNSILILFPFFIYQWQETNLKVSRLGFAFVTGVLAVTFYGFICANLQLNSDELSVMLQQGHFYYSNHTGLHPTYLATFLVFGFFFIIEYVRKHRVNVTLGLLAVFVPALLYILVMILFLRARISIIVLVFGLLIYFILIMRRSKEKIILLIVCLAISVIGLLKIDLKNFLSAHGRNGFWAMEDRIAIWKGSWEGYKFSPLFGGGTGGAQYLIDEGFLEIGYDYGLDNIRNAHNQYLQYLCRNGILDLLVFLSICAFCYYRAYKQKSIIFFIFLFIANFTMISESFLNKQKGLAFFYFFVCAYIYLKDE